MNLFQSEDAFSRRSVLRTSAVAGMGGIAAAAIAGFATASGRRRHDAQIPLHSGAVSFSSAGEVLTANAAPGAATLPLFVEGVERDLWRPGHAPLIDGTRVREDADGADALVAHTQAFLGATRHAPAATPHPIASTDLEMSALLDVHSLTWALPSPVAGWTHNWRYTWPRDMAHVIVALHERGLHPWALELLDTLAAMQRDDGTFEARYHPGSPTPPDTRRAQFDGTGWFLWAAARVLTDGASGNGRVSAAMRLALAASAEALVRETSGKSRLPSPSPDYWEKNERRLTLATAAMTRAGLRAATTLAKAGLFNASSDGGAPARESGPAAPTVDALLRREAEVSAALTSAFGKRGFQRYRRGGGVDAGLLMLLPPYASALPALGSRVDVRARLADAWVRMARPAGGVAPAQSWKRDGVSWTPQTAMFAQAFAHVGELDRAGEIVQWLANHRTVSGAIPEKVLADGSPAAVAPLAWPAATVLSTLIALDDA